MSVYVPTTMKLLGIIFLAVGMIPAWGAQCPHYLSHHVVGDKSVVPGVYFLRMALEQARASGPEVVGISDFTVRRRLLYAEISDLNCTFDQRGRLVCVNNDGVNARGKILEADTAAPVVSPALGGATETHRAEDLYAFLAKRGLFYGEYFTRLRDPIEREGNIVTGAVEIHNDFLSAGDSAHPTILDASLHLLSVFLLEKKSGVTGNRVAVPVRFGKVVWYSRAPASPSGRYWAAVRLLELNEEKEQLLYDLTLYNDSGQIVLSVGEGMLHGISADELTAD